MKKILLAPFLMIDTLLDRLLAVIGAIAGMQFPQFFSLYLQRLGGHKEELSKLVMAYKESAKSSGKSLQEFVQLHLQSPIQDFANSGKIMQEKIIRFDEINSAYNSLAHATIYNKIVVFVKEMDFEIAKAVAKTYTFGIPLTLESLAYGGIGLLLVIILYALIKKTLQIIAGKIFRRRSGKARPRTGNVMTIE